MTLSNFGFCQDIEQKLTELEQKVHSSKTLKIVADVYINDELKQHFTTYVKGDNVHSYMDKVEIVKNGTIQATIVHDNKKILVSELPAGANNENNILYTYKALLPNMSEAYKIREINGDEAYEIILQEQKSMYKKVQMSFNTLGHLVEIRLFPKKDYIGSRRIVYKEWSFDLPLKNELFSLKKITKDPSKWEDLQEEYEDYTVRKILNKEKNAIN
ncbi:hypothetical protein [Flammeovirga sp. SJP92]|uniref:hypothetical protein n=1 Tax=Flammeovirga sp. SJP92 TaxID=1775430 RepID=UPI0007884DF5|nr:hypothetical protein [Flammeovirga sp. SJP92]KXX67800.1 hypothetical protein AVL50_25395 [Flammeovirga sp. SJP92]